MKITFILAVLCLGFTSCQKDYTCECAVGATGTVRSFQVNSVKEKQAKDKCSKYQNDVNTTFLGTNTPVYTCVVK